MKRSFCSRTTRTAAGVLAGLCIATMNAYSQSPQPAAENSPTPGAALEQPRPDADALRKQIEELSSALRLMHDDLEAARGEARELKQELQTTREQVMAIKTELARQAPGQSTPQPAAATAETPTEPESRAQQFAMAGVVQDTEKRTAKLEEEQSLLSARVDDQYQTKVESGSKYRLQLSGMALFNAYSTRGNVDNSDMPGFAIPAYPTSTNAEFGATVRQSVIGLDLYGPEIAGAKSKADLRADFFGGFPSYPEGVTSPLFRIRTGGMRLEWDSTSLIVGQYAPFISPLSPSSLASVAYPAFASSGNLWVWTPEIYLEHRMPLSDGFTLTAQGGFMDPLTGELPPDPFYRAPEAGEKTGHPAYAGRIELAHGTGESRSWIAVGGYYGTQNWEPVRNVHSWAGTADWSTPLGRLISLSGEFYRGQAIGGLGAGEGRSVAYISTEYNPWYDVLVPDSTGGWAQLKFTPSERVEFNGAFGEDFTPVRVLPNVLTSNYAYSLVPVGRNQSASINSIYHLRSNVLVSLEYRRLRTAESQPGILRANQVTFSAATLF